MYKNEKKKAYVVGTNVSTSLSPTIFQYWFEKHNIDGEYGYLEIKEENFDKKIKSLLKEVGLVGLNITMPFKEKIFSYLTKQDKHSAQIKAINCVSINKNSISGINTDWIGFKNVLENFITNTYNYKSKKKPHLNKTFQYDTAAVIGYGGAGKAIIYALIQTGFRQIKVFNRTFEKIKNINSDLVVPLRLGELLKHTLKSDIIVNTTPNTNIFAELIHSEKYDGPKFVDYKNVGADINYKSRDNNTILGCFFSAHRIRGIEMLVAQAAPCFESWFGLLPDINDSDLKNLLMEKIKGK